MNIIIKNKTYTQSEYDQALRNEVVKELEKENQGNYAREVSAAQEAERMKGSGGNNFQHRASIPAEEFHRLVHKYGHKEVHSKDFQKHLRRHYPHLTTGRV